MLMVIAGIVPSKTGYLQEIKVESEDHRCQPDSKMYWILEN